MPGQVKSKKANVADWKMSGRRNARETSERRETGEKGETLKNRCEKGGKGKMGETSGTRLMGCGSSATVAPSI